MKIKSKHTVDMDDFNTIKLLGRGVFSEVYLVKKKSTEEYFAMKSIHKKNPLELLDREMTILKNVFHPNIVMLKEVIKDDISTKLIMEYCSKGDLNEYLNMRRMKEKSALHFLYQILQGLQYLHSNDIIHRDIKPQNILIDKNNVCKIADFGFARYKDQDKLLETMCGSPLYMAPEIIKHQHYTMKADMWSVGVVFYQMLTGQQPLKSKNFYELSKKIDNGDASISIPLDIPSKSRVILENILIFDSVKRIDVFKCLELVNDAIINENNIFQMDNSLVEPCSSVLLESSESNKLLEISYEPMPMSLLDNKDIQDSFDDIASNSTETSDNIIENITNSTKVVIKNVNVEHHEEWFTVKNSDYIHKDREDKMYYSDPLYTIVSSANNVMDDTWKIFKKASNLISNIGEYNSV
jgi:serine/threonine protein kinase